MKIEEIRFLDLRGKRNFMFMYVYVKYWPMLTFQKVCLVILLCFRL